MYYMKLFILPALAIIIDQTSATLTFNSTFSQDFEFDGRVPAGTVSEGCGAAYSAVIECSSLLLKLRDSSAGPDIFTKEGLSEVCTTECINSLNDWDKKIQEDCTDQDKLLVEDPTGSFVYLSMVLRNTHSIQENLYWAFCLKDSKTETYCLVDNNLPDWPTGSNETEAVATAFCKSDCRTQQSYLMYLSYNNSDLADAEETCPGLDTSVFPMNVNILGAFGAAASSSLGEGNVGNNTEGKIEGTDFNWDFYVQDFNTVSNDTTYQGSGVAAVDKSIGLKTGFSTSFAFISVFLAVTSTLLL